MRVQGLGREAGRVSWARVKASRELCSASVSRCDFEAETLEVEGVAVRVATPETLVRMKRGTPRAIDAADAAALARLFGIQEE